ncbi:MAG: alpha/beta fold hydrolase, partial [Anaerolineales bacterium]|nr:alpha/beta fold hydrolase [Anaerolineales bacterium]
MKAKKVLVVPSFLQFQFNMARFVWIVIFIFIIGCASFVSPTNTLPAPIVTIIHPTETITPVPTLTIIPSPTAIPYLMYPYTIAGLRERNFTGGEISLDVILGLTNTYIKYLISYPSDGLRITGILQIPAGDGPFPIIIMNHGYANRSTYTSGDGTERASVYLVERGYITIAPDFRTWGGSDIAPSFFHAGLVTDVMNLIASLDSIPQADVTRIGMWGHSMGGGITTKVLTLNSPVRAAVLYAPNSADDADLIARWGYGCIGDISAGELLQTCNSADVIPESLEAEIIAAYVESATNPEMMREIAPFYHLESVSVPIQIHIGSADGDYIG